MASAPDSEELRRKLRREGRLVLDIKAIPRARCSEVSDQMPDGTFKVRVTAAPEHGKANDEVCAVLAEYLGVPKRNVEVIAGFRSRQKRVRATGLYD